MRRSEIASLGVLLFASVASLLHSGDIRSVREAVSAPKMPETPARSATAGDVLRLRLQSAPFPHPDRQNGYQYAQTQYPADPHYTDPSVAVFVPYGFRADSPVNLVFFFHGWYSTIDDAEQKFDLYRQFSQSGVHALLVLPELARNAPDSFGGKLHEKGGFTRMVSELLGQLSTDGVIGDTRVGSIVLAGHSGAFQVIGDILKQGDLSADIKEIFLFDALYAFIDQYRRWIEAESGRFISVIAADGEENTDVNALISALRKDRVAFQVAPDDPDADAQTLGSRVLFMKSSSDHFGVIFDHDEFRRLLSTSTALAR
jgi:hypothetical protein